MNRYVIDTNVLLAADDRDEPRLATHLSLSCRLKSLHWLQTFLQLRHRLALDDQGLILAEYRRKPRYGDFAYQFLRVVLGSDLIEWVPISTTPDGTAILPKQLEEVIHDRADRKFVAVALAGPETADVVNSADSDWVEWQSQLQCYGVGVIHICKEEHGWA